MSIHDDYEPRLDDGIRQQLEGPTPPTAKQVRLGCGCLSLLVIGVALLSSLRPYLDYLWFVHDAGHPEVFTLAYVTKAKLFIIAFVIALIPLVFSLGRAAKVGMVYL
ncbi:MAG TPA: hypothetical protein VM328_05115, partial [Fimbriimonadaceae bacterium]|nr:hypothetical protein [Fimbriimonadaceae bacterium]